MAGAKRKPPSTKVSSSGGLKVKGVGPGMMEFGGMRGAAMGTKKAGAAKAMTTARVNVTKATGGAMRSAGRQGMKAPPKSPVKPTYRSPTRGDNGNR